MSNEFMSGLAIGLFAGIIINAYWYLIISILRDKIKKLEAEEIECKRCQNENV